MGCWRYDFLCHSYANIQVVGIPDVTRLGLIQSKMATGVRLAQGGSVSFLMTKSHEVDINKSLEFGQNFF